MGRNAGTSTREEAGEAEVVVVVAAVEVIIVEALLSPTEVVEVGYAAFHSKSYTDSREVIRHCVSS